MVISPTPGRIVWYIPPVNTGESGFAPPSAGEPLAAQVARVWSDNCVNLMVVDAEGRPHPRTSVLLVQEGEKAPDSGNYCMWMPFQRGQAAAAKISSAGPGSDDHASKVLYPAIKAAMEELEALPAGFNFAVNRAYNHLHGAFWSECPMPASAAPLRPIEPAGNAQAQD